MPMTVILHRNGTITNLMHVAMLSWNDNIFKERIILTNLISQGRRTLDIARLSPRPQVRRSSLPMWGGCDHTNRMTEPW